MTARIASGSRPAGQVPVFSSCRMVPPVISWNRLDRDARVIASRTGGGHLQELGDDERHRLPGRCAAGQEAGGEPPLADVGGGGPCLVSLDHETSRRVGHGGGLCCRGNVHAVGAGGAASAEVG